MRLKPTSRLLRRVLRRVLGSGERAYTGLVQTVLDVSNDVAAELAGIGDGILDALRERLGCTINLRGNRLTLTGDEMKVAEA